MAFLLSAAFTFIGLYTAAFFFTFDKTFIYGA